MTIGASVWSDSFLERFILETMFLYSIQPANDLLLGPRAEILSQGRNRRCITIDMRSEKGREVVKRLANNVDVLVENFRPGGSSSATHTTSCSGVVSMATQAPPPPSSSIFSHSWNGDMYVMVDVLPPK